METTRKNFIKFFVIAFFVFLISIITIEVVFGKIFIDRFSDKIETARKRDYDDAWSNYIKLREREFDAFVSGYAHWDELAESVLKRENQTVIDYLDNDDLLLNKLDLFLLVNDKKEIIYKVVEGIEEFEFTDTLPDDYLTLAMIEENLNLSYEKKKTASEDVVKIWKETFIVEIFSKRFFIAVSGICNNEGDRVTEGCMIFGYSLEHVLDDAEKILQIDINQTKSISKKAYHTIIVENQIGRDIFLEIIPGYYVKSLYTSFFIYFMIVLILFIMFAFTIIYFVFTTKYTRHLRKKVQEQTKIIRRKHEEKRELIRKNTALSTIVTASHELNQPLMILAANFEVLKTKIDYDNLTEEQVKYCHRIEESLVKIMKLMDKYREAEFVGFKDYVDGTVMTTFEKSEEK